MSFLYRAFRQYVSADKNRFVDKQFNLDLTYITDRIIAMAFPADGVESTYRNYIEDVAKFLDERHMDRYLIFNLSGRDYNYERFGGKVLSWCSFPDHHPPPLWMLCKLMTDMDAFLKEGNRNVVIVHCMAGKGRTGTVIASFLLFERQFIQAKDALDFFARMRSQTGYGVTYPSQRRYVSYFQKVLYKEVTIKPVFIEINSVTFSGFPEKTFSNLGSTAIPIFSFYSVSIGELILYSSSTPSKYGFTKKGDYGFVFHPNTIVRGDVLFRLEIQTSFRQELTLRVNIHTSFLTGNELIFGKEDLDLVEKDKRFDSNFSMKIKFTLKEKIDYTKDETEAITREAESVQKVLTTIPGDGTICWVSGEGENDPKVKVQQALALCATDQGLPKVEKCGWLTKQGHTIKNWKRRWFVLRDGVLSYYKSQKNATMCGSISLEEIFMIRRDIPASALPSSTGETPQGYFFELSAYKNDSPLFYYICAQSEVEAEDWTEAIENSQAAVKASTTPKRDFEESMFSTPDPTDGTTPSQLQPQPQLPTQSQSQSQSQSQPPPPAVLSALSALIPATAQTAPATTGATVQLNTPSTAMFPHVSLAPRTTYGILAGVKASRHSVALNEKKANALDESALKPQGRMRATAFTASSSMPEPQSPLKQMIGSEQHEIKEEKENEKNEKNEKDEKNENDEKTPLEPLGVMIEKDEPEEEKEKKSVIDENPQMVDEVKLRSSSQ
eukprot:TRINITY_DN1537_c0_g1_i2.p1 TRINITY_DN1537_c0_g1~~TRINITY_DN1537_c0_g1_i2.p1  ORF type:complete len:725 (-),score=226.17 TRINITY_DN1537_c0_g1_i2:67-2241(-)